MVAELIGRTDATGWPSQPSPLLPFQKAIPKSMKMDKFSFQSVSESDQDRMLILWIGYI